MAQRPNQNRRQPLEPIFDGRRMLCPHCRQRFDLLEIETLSENVAYQDQTVPVHRCPRGHYFALASQPVVHVPPAPRPRKRRR